MPVYKSFDGVKHEDLGVSPSGAHLSEIRLSDPTGDDDKHDKKMYDYQSKDERDYDKLIERGFPENSNQMILIQKKPIIQHNKKMYGSFSIEDYLRERYDKAIIGHFEQKLTAPDGSISEEQLNKAVMDYRENPNPSDTLYIADRFVNELGSGGGQYKIQNYFLYNERAEEDAKRFIESKQAEWTSAENNFVAFDNEANLSTLIGPREYQSLQKQFTDNNITKDTAENLIDSKAKLMYMTNMELFKARMEEYVSDNYDDTKGSSYTRESIKETYRLKPYVERYEHANKEFGRELKQNLVEQRTAKLQTLGNIKSDKESSTEVTPTTY